jgi:hypothetical protein
MRSVLTMAVLLLALPLQAGGSVDFADVQPLLRAKPALAAVLASMEVAPHGVATRIGTNVNPRLGGMRIGPYLFDARVSGRTVRVELHTKIAFLDARGRATDVERAVKVSETLERIEISEP